jgi:hypothetical protein
MKGKLQSWRNDRRKSHDRSRSLGGSLGGLVSIDELERAGKQPNKPPSASSEVKKASHSSCFIFLFLSFINQDAIVS